MKNDEIQICDCFSVFGLKDILVDIQLKGVVPEIRVWKVFDCGVSCEFVGAVGFCDFATAFPVVDQEGVPPPYGGSCDALLASFGKSRTVYARLGGLGWGGGGVGGGWGGGGGCGVGGGSRCGVGGGCEGGVCGGVRVDHLIHHINRPCNPCFFMEYRPFRSVGAECGAFVG